MKPIPVNEFSDLTDHLRRCIQAALPGRDAHLKMIPASRKPEFLEVKTGIRSAVLLLIYPDADEIKTVLIQRPNYQGYHSGQISLPGGKFDPGDSDLRATALREAYEETHIPADEIMVIGELTTLYIPPSGFLMTPFLAFASRRPDFKIDPAEVASLIEAGLHHFNDTNLREKEIPLHDGRVVSMPYYDVMGHTIWGATGMVMSELSLLLHSFRK